MGKVGTCNDCQAPIVGAFDERTGMIVQLDLDPVPRGPYEIVGDSIMRQRKTKAGKIAKGGKGHRPHACRTVELHGIGRIADPPIATTRIEQELAAELNPPEPYRCPAAIIEAEALLGRQEGSQTVDWQGSLGRTTCGLCGAAIIAAAHHLTGNTVLLHDHKLDAGPWRAFQKDGVPLADFRGAADKHATYVNHRLLCEGAHA